MQSKILANPYADKRAIECLGPVILACRYRRRDHAHEALVGTRIMLFFLPIILGLLMIVPAMLLLAAIPAKAFFSSHPRLIIAYLIGCVLAGIVFFYRYYFSAPAGNLLILHEHGFRHATKTIRFEDVASMELGSAFSSVEAGIHRLNRRLGFLSGRNSAAASMMEASRDLTVTVRFKNAPEYPMRFLLGEAEPGDLEAFFEAARSAQIAVPPTKRLVKSGALADDIV